MNWKTWTQLLAALLIAGLCLYIGKLILPVVQTMTPVIGWTLGVVIVVVLISIGLGVPAAIFLGLRSLHLHHTVREIEARKLPVTERGFIGGYLSRQEQILVPQITAHSVEVPGHVHIQQEEGSHDAATAARMVLAAAKDLQAGRLLPAPQEAPALVPPACTLSQVLAEFHPTADRLLLGYLGGREPATSSAGGLCHVALAGATGGGKSSLIRLLIAQLCYVGATVLLLNPHYTRYDLESGEDWTPFEPYLYADPIQCKDYRAIAYYLQHVAQVMLPARLEKYARSQPVGAPFYLVLDELPAIVKHVPDAPGWMADLLREGRKVKLFLVTAAQDFLVKTVMGKQGGGAVRDCFRTAVYVGGDPTTARVLLDVRGSVDDGGLGRGIVLLRSAQVKQAALARVPYVDNESLYRLLGPSTYSAGENRDEVQSLVESDERGEEDVPDRLIVEADPAEKEPGHERPANVRDFPQTGVHEPVERSDASPKTYRLTEQEITAFIAAYKACGSIDKALSSIGRGGWYKKHASEVVKAHNLRKEA